MKYTRAKSYIPYLNSTSLLRSVSCVGSEFGSWFLASGCHPGILSLSVTINVGLTAATYQELLDKGHEILLLSGVVTLVLEENVTSMESEQFFQMLDDDTRLMILEKGQNWSPIKSGVLSYGLGQEKSKHSKEIASITFDMYYQKPQDLFNRFNVKSMFYGLYSMSYDFQGLGSKKELRELLQWTSTLLQGLGNMLLSVQSTLHHEVEGAKQWQGQVRLQAY